MSALHAKTRALLFVAAAHRPTREDWRSDPLERAIGEWVQAGAPDIEWEFSQNDANRIVRLHNEYRLGFYNPNRGEE